MIIPITHFLPDPQPEPEGSRTEDGIDVGLGACCEGEDICEEDVPCEGDWLRDWLSATTFGCSRSLLISETKSSNPENPFPFFWSTILSFLCMTFAGHETDFPRRRSIFASSGSVFNGIKEAILIDGVNSCTGSQSSPLPDHESDIR